jgi:hypothetical protein
MDRVKRLPYETLANAERRVLILQGRVVEAFNLDPDDYWCCSGGPSCPCGGISNAEAATKRHAEQPLFTVEPYIEAREVGEWLASPPSKSKEQG